MNFRQLLNPFTGVVAEVISFICLFSFYHPPKHPKGVPWKEGIRGLDYVGAALITPGVALTLVGIIYTVSLFCSYFQLCRVLLTQAQTFLPSTDKLVLIPLIVGLVLVACFGVWETFSKTKYKLCPPEICKLTQLDDLYEVYSINFSPYTQWARIHRAFHFGVHW